MLDKIKTMETAAGGYMVKSEETFSENEMKDAMRAILERKKIRQNERNEMLSNGYKALEQKAINDKIAKQEQKIQTLKYQVEQTKKETEAKAYANKLTAEYEQMQKEMKALKEFEEKANIKESKYIKKIRTFKE